MAMPLTVKDHTLIMGALMSNPLQVVRHLPRKYKTKKGIRPPGSVVLSSALQVKEIDRATKARIRMVLKALPKFERGVDRLSTTQKQTLQELRKLLARRRTIDDKCRVFRNPRLLNRHLDDGLAHGMETAARMLEDGRRTIYSPDHPFFKWGSRGSGASGSTAREVTFGDLADTDGVLGAAGGAIGLGFAGPGGAAVGAVIGGAGASAGFALAWIVDSIWDLF